MSITESMIRPTWMRKPMAAMGRAIEDSERPFVADTDTSQNIAN